MLIIGSGLGGKVVALHEQFAWLQNSNSREYYFKPVAEIKPAAQGGAIALSA